MKYSRVHPDQLEKAISRALCSAACPSLSDRILMVLSGGRTPAIYLPFIAKHWPFWERTDLLLSDERFVPISDPASNEALIRRTLQDQISIDGCRLISVLEAGSSPESAAEGLERTLMSLGSWPPKIAFLGIGSDGHIASLFPSMDPRFSLDRRCIAARAPEIFPTRVSLTLGALCKVEQTVFVISGEEKRAVMHAAIQGQSDTPLARLFTQIRDRVHVIEILSPADN